MHFFPETIFISKLRWFEVDKLSEFANSQNHVLDLKWCQKETRNDTFSGRVRGLGIENNGCFPENKKHCHVKHRSELEIRVQYVDDDSRTMKLLSHWMLIECSLDDQSFLNFSIGIDSCRPHPYRNIESSPLYFDHSLNPTRRASVERAAVSSASGCRPEELFGEAPKS